MRYLAVDGRTHPEYHTLTHGTPLSRCHTLGMGRTRDGNLHSLLSSEDEHPQGDGGKVTGHHRTMHYIS